MFVSTLTFCHPTNGKIEHYLPGLLPHDKEKELDHSSDALLRMRNSLLNMDVRIEAGDSKHAS